MSLELRNQLQKTLGDAYRLERALDTGPQTWKQFAYAMLLSNVVMFVLGFVVLATQPWHGKLLNPDDKGMLSPSTIFNTCCSFVTNTNLQHYSGEQNLSYFSQLACIVWLMFVTPAAGA